MLYGIVAVAAALLLTGVLTELLRALALRTGIVDRPGARKPHTRPTPHLGGVAVAAATLAVATSGLWTGLASLGSGVGPLLGAGAAVALLGLVDDLRPLGAMPRLVVETLGAGVVAYSAGLSYVTGLLAVAWIVFVTNAFNLLDNSDGAMGTVAAITAFGLAICAITGGMPELALLLCALAAALSGFLVHNWHPARIFLGDCGSLFTGFVLSSAAVLVHTGAPLARTTATLLALTLVVTADTVLVVISRYRVSRRLLEGGTDHIAHRLVRLGIAVPAVAVILGVAAFAGTLIGLLIYRTWLPPAAVLLPAAVAVVAIGWLLRVPVYSVAGHHRLVDRPREAPIDQVRG